MPKAKKEPENKLLSRRVNFPSVHDIIDEYLPSFKAYLHLNDEQEAAIREAFFTIFERFLFSASYAATLGAEKGIREAFEMMKDEKYYETVKKRRQADRERWKFNKSENDERQKEYERRKNFPTRDEKIADIRSAIHDMAYNRKAYHKHRDLIFKYQDEDGNQILVDAIKRSTNGLEDVNFLTFDVDAWVKAISSLDIQTPPPNREKILDDSDGLDFFDQFTEFDDEAKNES